MSYLGAGRYLRINTTNDLVNHGLEEGDHIVVADWWEPGMPAHARIRVYDDMRTRRMQALEIMFQSIELSRRFFDHGYLGEAKFLAAVSKAVPSLEPSDEVLIDELRAT